MCGIHPVAPLRDTSGPEEQLIAFVDIGTNPLTVKTLIRELMQLPPNSVIEIGKGENSPTLIRAIEHTRMAWKDGVAADFVQLRG